MKKIVICLLIMGLLIVAIPFNVSADMALSIPDKDNPEKRQLDNGDWEYTYTVELNRTGTDASTGLSKVEFSVSYPSGVKSVSFDDDGSGYKATKSGTNPVTFKLTFDGNEDDAPKETTTFLGEVKSIVKNDSTDEDCTLRFTLGGGETVNPPTGSVIPYSVILGGAVLATSIYTVTNKKTKLHKI